VSLSAITLCVASQRVFIVDDVHFVTYSVRKLLDTPSDARSYCTNLVSAHFEESGQGSGLLN
jgi:predicted MarR family transcription regulator